MENGERRRENEGQLYRVTPGDREIKSRENTSTLLLARGV